MSTAAPPAIRPSAAAPLGGIGRRAIAQVRALLPDGHALPEPTWRARHQAVVVILWLHALALTAYVVATSALDTHVLEPAALAALALVAGRPTLGRHVRSGAATVGMVTASALLVHLSGGYVEAHFHFFVVIALVALYQDWTVFALALLYVVLHHAVLGALSPQDVYNHPAAWEDPWRWALIHGAFVLAASAVNVAAWRLNESAGRALERSSREALRANEALRASEARVRAIVQSAATGIVVADLAGRLVEANPALERILGYSAEQLAGMALAELTHADDVERHQALFARLIRGEIDDYRIEKKCVRNDGEMIWANLNFALLRDADGAPHLAVGLVEDVTDQKWAAERLEEALAQLQTQYGVAARARSVTDAVLDTTADAIVLLGPAGEFLRANRSMTEFFGSELAGVSSMGEFFMKADDTFEDVAPVRAIGERAFAEPEAELTGLATIVKPTRRDISILGRPVHLPEGDYLGRVFVVRDVTRERAVDRMKTEFVSLVSHELRTPLTSIKGYVDLLIDGEVGDVPAEQLEFLGIVKSNADRLVALINDLLDVSRLDSGRVELRRAAVSVAQIVEGVAGTLARQIAARGQTLELDLDPGLPPAWADADRVIQIVTNLLSNAHKYTPDGGRIEVAARLDGAGVLVSVRDSGIGISPEDQARLFTRFFRSADPAAQGIGGTGLGLAITRSLVEMHGGTITLDSAPGQGSTFSFSLPLAEEAPALTAQPGADRPIGRRILVVEDEPDIARLLRRYLERGGYEVLLAGDGPTALRLARLERPDLITLDVMLPGADGLTVLEWLKADAIAGPIPVVLVSIVADEGRAALLGAAGYLAKPVDETALLDGLAAILAGGPVSERETLAVQVDREAVPLTRPLPGVPLGPLPLGVSVQ